MAQNRNLFPRELHGWRNEKKTNNVGEQRSVSPHQFCVFIKCAFVSVSVSIILYRGWARFLIISHSGFPIIATIMYLYIYHCSDNVSQSSERITTREECETNGSPLFPCSCIEEALCGRANHQLLLFIFDGFFLSILDKSIWEKIRFLMRLWACIVYLPIKWNGNARTRHENEIDGKCHHRGKIA